MQSFVKGMEVIGDNIANSKTVGFKKQRVSYADNFSNTLRDAAPGGEGLSNQTPIQIGAGVQVSAAQKIFSQGSIELTGVATDLAISGKGFFRVMDDSGEERVEYLTRDGSFRIDAEGYMVDKNGYYLLGLSNGSAAETPLQNGTLGKIQIRIPDDQRIKVDTNGNPIDGSNRLVLSDGTRAARNDDGVFFRVDAGGRLLDTPRFPTASFVVNIPEVDVSARAVWIDDDFYLVNAAGSFIDASGTALSSYDPTAPVGDPGAVWDRTPPVAPAADTRVQPVGSRTVIPVNLESDPNEPAIPAFWAYNKADGNFYRINSAGNYIDDAGAEINTPPIRFVDTQAPDDISITPPVTLPADAAELLARPIGFDSAEAVVLMDIGNVSARAVLHDDGKYYLTNSSGNYINAAGEEIGTGIPFNAANPNLNAVEWNPAQQRVMPVSDPRALSFAALGTSAIGTGGFSGAQIAEPNVNDPNQFLLTINSWSFNQSGLLNVTLNDGSSYSRAQVLLQQVQDEDALVEQGNGLFTGFRTAGVIGGLETWHEQRYTGTQLLPNQSSNGAIISRALEGSNTDLTREFADMITTQRAFQAGSRVISVSDEMLQEIINLKR